jgi:acetyl esterase/lipase
MDSKLFGKAVGRGQVNRIVLLSTFVLLLSIGVGNAQRERRRNRTEGGQSRQKERLDSKGTVYATADDGTPLKWVVFPAEGPGPHASVLIIHGGHFATLPASPNSLRAARDLAAAGFNAFYVRYRLAPPGSLPGQKSDGRYPDQTNDLKQAVRAARAYSGGNGKVGAIGGSAGASHVVYLAATGTKGDDRLDAGVGLSGAYDFVELVSTSKRVIQRKIENYVGSADLEAIRKASPINFVDASVSPLYVVASGNETMPPGQLPDLVRKLQQVGATNFKQLFRENSHQHAFSNWPDVRQEALQFLQENLGGPAEPMKLAPPPPRQSQP